MNVKCKAVAKWYTFILDGSVCAQWFTMNVECKASAQCYTIIV